MKRLVVLGLIIVGVFFGGHLFAGSAFDQAVDTAIDSIEAAKDGQWNDPFPSYPHHTDEERKKFLDEINQKIPIPTPKIEKDENEGSMLLDPSQSYCNSKSYSGVMIASSVNCTPWNEQFDGCYKRVCCCDKNGAHYCERCCPDAKGECVAYRTNCLEKSHNK